MTEELEIYNNDISKINIINDNIAEEFRLKYLSKNGLIKELSNKLKSIEPEYRKEYGSYLRELKLLAENKYEFYLKNKI